MREKVVPDDDNGVVTDVVVVVVVTNDGGRTYDEREKEGTKERKQEREREAISDLEMIQGSEVYIKEGGQEEKYNKLSMASKLDFIFIGILLFALVHTQLVGANFPFNRTIFPSDFTFGASSAAYQYEGAWNEGGRKPSIWDTFTHKYPGKISDGNNGDVADDFYHKYKGDVKLMKYIGLDGFRFSISWPRVIPSGKLSGGINKEGIRFYNNVINELIANGIMPLVTIFHWDLPQPLQDQFGGFLSQRIVKHFQDFAELCFKEFGDRVKHWITINEPYIFVTGGYDTGTLAPGRCSAWRNNNCSAGNSAIEPYVVGHNLLLCHAATVKIYKQKYQAYQKGIIGITLVSHWFVAYSNSNADKKAQQRALDFMYGWYIHPLVYGSYPKNMISLVGKRLPKFTAEQSALVKGSYDFIGINYYTSNFAFNTHYSNSINVSFTTDNQVNQTTQRNGKDIGPATDISIFFEYPQGIRDLLVYTKEKYNNPVIYITENGIGENNNRTTQQGVKDQWRINFYRGHIMAVNEALQKGVRVKGFFAWSFLDTFEWNGGYTSRFGIVYVDYKDALKRHLKQSALWFKKFLLK